MTADTQDKEPKPGVLASLKGAWRKVAGARSSGTAGTPKPADQQTAVDEAPIAAPVATPAPETHAVAEASPVIEEPAAAAAEPAAAAEESDADEAEPVSEPLEVAAPTAAKSAQAEKPRKPVPAQDPVLGESTPALGGASSPFIAPAMTEPGPDSSWTVAQLRSLAKERGVRGYSSMSKSQLLASLGNPQA